jgi:signal transduction histidine kinase
MYEYVLLKRAFTLAIKTSREKGFVIKSSPPILTAIIISNAVKYTDLNGTVTIYSELLASETLLHIKDSGIGIKAEDISRVFEKSFTGSNGREVKTSTGIGLYLSQKLAKKLGHYITIESELNSGTTVTIHFPKWSDYYKVTKV